MLSRIPNKTQAMPLWAFWPHPSTFFSTQHFTLNWPCLGCQCSPHGLWVLMVPKPCRNCPTCMKSCTGGPGATWEAAARHSCLVGISHQESFWHLSILYYCQNQGGCATTPAVIDEKSFHQPSASWSPWTGGPQPLGWDCPPPARLLLQRAGRE